MHNLSNFEACNGRSACQQQVIKEEKLKWLFQLLKDKGEMARTDLARATGLSPTTISALVEELIRRNLVVEAGYAHAAQGGRRPINLRINAAGRQIPALAFDRGGLCFELYNLGMEVIEAFRMDWNAGRDFADMIRDALRQSKLLCRDRIAGLCICAADHYEPERRALDVAGVEIPIDDLTALEQELQKPLFFGAATQGLAYAEARALERRGECDGGLIYACVSEKVESCIYLDGDIYSGRDNRAGQLGHISINYRGRPCACGGRGCLERYVNSAAVLEHIAQAAAFKPCRMLDRLTCGDMENLTLKMIGEAYDAEETLILEAVDDVAEQLFTGIYSLVCATGVGRVVLGGDIVQLGGNFLERMRQFAQRVRGSHLPRGIRFDYGSASSGTLGIVEYFIDKRFEIDRSRN